MKTHIIWKNPVTEDTMRHIIKKSFLPHIPESLIPHKFITTKWKTNYIYTIITQGRVISKNPDVPTVQIIPEKNVCCDNDKKERYIGSKVIIQNTIEIMLNSRVINETDEIVLRKFSFAYNAK